MVRYSFRLLGLTFLVLMGLAGTIRYLARIQSAGPVFVYSVSADPVDGSRLFVFDPDHAMHINLLRNRAITHGTVLSMAPDGRQILFRDELSGIIFHINTDGGVQEYHLRIREAPIFWRPDSQEFGILTNIMYSDRMIWYVTRVNLIDGTISDQRLPETAQFGLDSMVRWLPDNTLRIATITRRGVSLQSLELDTLRLQTIQEWDFEMRMTGSNTLLDEAGERIIVPAIAASGFDFELYKFTVGEEAVENISAYPLRNDLQPLAILEGDLLLYRANNGARQSIVLHSFATGEETLLHQIQEGRLSFVNLTADGRYLISRIDYPPEDTSLCLLDLQEEIFTCPATIQDLEDALLWMP